MNVEPVPKEAASQTARQAAPQAGSHVSPAATPALDCRGVVRRFGGLVALSGVDMQVRQGEIFGLVGPNGSGKTTMTNAITGFYPPN